MPIHYVFPILIYICVRILSILCLILRPQSTRSVSTPSRSWWGCRSEEMTEQNWKFEQHFGSIWRIFRHKTVIIINGYNCSYQGSLTIFVFKDVRWRENVQSEVPKMLNSWLRRSFDADDDGSMLESSIHWKEQIIFCLLWTQSCVYNLNNFSEILKSQ